MRASANPDRAQRGIGNWRRLTSLGYMRIVGVESRGHFQLQLKTRRDRLRLALRKIKKFPLRRRHDPASKQAGGSVGARRYFVYHGTR